MTNKESISYRVFSIFNHGILFFLGIICLLPLIQVIALSFSASEYVTANKVNLIPMGLNLENYKLVFETEGFIKSVGISILRVIAGTFVNMLMITITAYPLFWEAAVFKGRNVIMWLMVFPLLFTGGLIPQFLLVRNIGLLDSFWSLIIPGALPIWSTIMMMNFFRGLPKDICESAMIDGAQHWTILFRIFIPLSGASVATLSLFAIVGHWNAWFDGMLYLNDSTKWPLQTLLQYAVKLATTLSDTTQVSAEDLKRVSKLSSRSMLSAQITLSIIPILCVYPFLQKYFVKGVVIGSVKG